MSNFADVGGAFTKHYYGLFDSDRSQLSSLYRDSSMLTFEGQQFAGMASIIEKLTSLPFTKVVHEVVTIDSQPAMNGAVLVSVNGNLQLDQDPPMKFAQTFHLIPEGQIYWVLNDIFRLNIG